MANTKVTGDLIASLTIATGNIANNAITSDKISGLTTAHITEGANLYYTDARARAAVGVSGNALSYNSSTGVITSNFEESPTFTGEVSLKSRLNLQRLSGGATTLIQFKNENSVDRAHIDFGGTNEELSFFAGAGTAENMRIDSSGNVAIGTTTPEQKLHVEGASITVNRGNDDSSIAFQNSTSGATWRIGRDYSNSEALTFAYSATDYPSLTGNGLIYINTSGNVGIGTTSPTTFSGYTTVAINNATQGGILELQSNGTSSLRLACSTSDSALWEPRNVPVLFGTNNTERMRIDSSGNVGIGTSSPAYMLDVNEKIRIVAGMVITPTTSNLYATDGTLSYYATTNGVYLNGAGPNGWLRLNASGNYNDTTSINIHGINSSSGQIDFRTTNAERMRITSSGNVGIGTSSPERILHLDADQGRPIIQLDKGGDKILSMGTGSSATGADDTIFQMFNEGTELVRIFTEGNSWLNGGNVGIGTTNPGYTFTVNKSITNDWLALFGNTYNGAGNGVLIDAGNGTSGEILRLRDKDGNNKVHFLSNGSVGIGTTSPAQKLHVNGNVRVGNDTGFIDFARPGGVIVGGVGWHTDNYFYVAGHPTAGTTAGNVVRVYAFGSLLSLGNPTAGDALTVAVNGNVGIGNTSPRDKLTIFTAAAAEEEIALRLVNPVGFTNGGSGASIIFAQDRNTGENLPMAKIRSSQSIAGTSSYGDLIFSTLSSTMQDRMTILSSGNVGINTTSPTEKLHVEGRIRLGSTPVICSHDNIGIDIDQNNNSGINYFRVTRDGELTELFRVQENGNVGIGTTTPQAKLDVAGEITIQNGLYTYKTQGYTAGNSTINVDITVGNEGGGGNVFKIEAGFAHYFGMAYNSIGEWWCTSRGTGVVNTYILNAGTSLAGTWSSSKPNTTTLRVTKSAGTYTGGGKWWIKVTYVPF